MKRVNSDAMDTVRDIKCVWFGHPIDKNYVQLFIFHLSESFSCIDSDLLSESFSCIDSDLLSESFSCIDSDLLSGLFRELTDSDHTNPSRTTKSTIDTVIQIRVERQKYDQIG